MSFMQTRPSKHISQLVEQKKVLVESRRNRRQDLSAAFLDEGLCKSWILTYLQDHIPATNLVHGLDLFSSLCS